MTGLEGPLIVFLFYKHIQVSTTSVLSPLICLTLHVVCRMRVTETAPSFPKHHCLFCPFYTLVEKKRIQRMKRAGKDQPTTETYESLVSITMLIYLKFVSIKVQCKSLLIL